MHAPFLSGSRRGPGSSRRRVRGVRTRAVTATLAVTALLLALPAAGGTAAAQSPTARQAAHGRTAQAGSPGDVVDARDSAFRVVPGVPTATRAWKIRYRSTGASGRPNVVSGTVVVPADHRTGPRPLLTYAVGTVGMGDQCAPSATFPQGTTAEAAFVEAALLRGWAVAVTDYEGLGTPGDHTYTVGRAEGTAVLDAARAAQRLPQARESGVTADSPVGIMGYSQGGQASGWAAELHHTYAPELKVKGSASGGVPADLPKVAAYNDGDPDAGLILMSAIGHDAAYPRLNLASYLNDEGRSLVKSMKSGCVADNTEAGANKSIGDVTVRNPLEQPDWKRRLADDRLGTRAPDFPAYLYHGTSDEIIPYGVGKRLRADWCARGTAVEWHAYPLSQHVGTAVLGGLPALSWLGDRFAGKPVRGNCAS